MLAVVFLLSAVAQPPAEYAAPAPDSSSIVKTLRKHQERFERFRRDQLPWTYPSYGRCRDRGPRSKGWQVIGQLCITFSDDEDWTPPDSERPAVGIRRLTLIDSLNYAAGLLPGSEWITNQQIRYVVEADSMARAQRVAAACQLVDPWRCHALSGFVHAKAHDFVAAERAFDRALAAMPPEQRCAWTDLSELLDGELRKSYRDLTCDTRGTLQQQIWHAADPFYSKAGNEIRVEHFVRHVHNMFVEDAAAPERRRWNNDWARSVIRYGWASGWERVRSPRTYVGPTSVVSYFQRGSASLFPDREKSGWEWDLERYSPRSQHAIPYAESLEPITTIHFAQFKRSDSTVVVAGFVFEDDSIQDDDTLTVALATHSANITLVTSRFHVGKTGAATLAIPPGRHYISLEVVAEAKRRAGRHREDLDAGRLHAAGVHVSDILVFQAFDSLPIKLDDATRLVTGPGEVRRGTRMGLYWEVYGLDPDALPIATTLTIQKKGKSFLRRLAEITPFASSKNPVEMEWRDARLVDGMLPRALSVALPSDVSPGEYVLTLDITTARGTTLEQTRTITVSKP